jgi:hypothetical protein
VSVATRAIKDLLVCQVIKETREVLDRPETRVTKGFRVHPESEERKEKKD